MHDADEATVCSFGLSARAKGEDGQNAVAKSTDQKLHEPVVHGWPCKDLFTVSSWRENSSPFGPYVLPRADGQ